MSTEQPEVGSVFVSNYPPYSFWKDDALGAVEEALDAPPRPDTPLGLYLHIPFCRRRCSFCYFRVYTDKESKQIARYLHGLAREIELLSERPAVHGRPVEFVYIGGGTPSYISVNHLRELVVAATAAMPWTSAREITFECEPGTLTRPKLEAIRDVGVTRLSLGIENFDDEILRLNGRAHVSTEIERVETWIHELDFPQLNVDLIAGMVGETWETWKTTVQKTIDYDPDSVTIYQMELPHNTVFTQELKDGELHAPLADWATKRAWHDYAIGELERAGFAISSAYTMVRADRPAKFIYRDALWHGADLLGTGVASFSHLSGVHFQNADNWDGYLDPIEAGRLATSRAYSTTEGERLTRELILQLKFGGIRNDDFRDKFGVDVLQQYAPVVSRLVDDQMAVVDDDQIRLTRAGLLQVDALLPRFYETRHQNARYT